ncbi:MAG: ABC transporter substrate-binding protein [Actinobacteria bacterium]|nr:ABC transporter substrate-binding protein [Actinomycetota bacterium]
MPVFAVLIFGGAVLLAGCGGSGSSSSATTGGATTSGGSGGDSGAATPSGSPVKLLQIVPLSGNGLTYPSEEQAGKVAAEWVNANGGLNGHPVELETCDDQNSPNTVQECARKALEGEQAAVVGTYTAYGTQMMPILEQAKIPYLPACCSYSAQETKSPYTFANDAGIYIFQGMGILAAEHCKKPTLVTVEQPAAEFLMEIAKAGLKIGGYTGQAREVLISASPGDYSAKVAEATSGGADCIVMMASEPNALAWYPAMEAAGDTQKVIGLAGNSISNELIAKFPTLLEGGLISDAWPPTSSPLWSTYVKAFETYSDPAKYNTTLLGAEGTWLNFMVLKQVTEGMKTIDRASLFQALNSASEVKTGGVTPTLNYTSPLGATKAPAFPRMMNSTGVFEEVKEGKIVALDEGSFHDLFTGEVTKSEEAAQ